MQILIAIGWLVAVGTILSIIFGPYNMQQLDYKATDLESAFYESFSRVCWAISLSWIIFACVHGYGGPVNWFLSLPQWQPLARLSYSIYLLHLPIQLILAASSRTHLNFTENLAVNLIFFCLKNPIYSLNIFHFRFTEFGEILVNLFNFSSVNEIKFVEFSYRQV